LTCRADDEAHIRALLLQGLAGGALALRGLDSNDLNATGRVRVTAHLTASTRIDAEVEKIVGRISLEPTITAARWEAETQLDPESRSALGQ
jgi:putative Mg2+ transporter-C (MgtC) family protein